MMAASVEPNVHLHTTNRRRGGALREEALARREEALIRREKAVRAAEAAAHRSCRLEQLMAQMREANARLVAEAVRAQTLHEQAEEANHLKDAFLATVSHELRTPVNAVLGWSQMLESKQLSAARAQDGLAAIRRSCCALAHMIDDLLDTSRILTGTLRVALQPVDLVVLTQAALDAVRPLADAKNMQLVFSATPRQRTVTGDACRLQQVIWNLVANAIKFTPHGGQVHVFIESSGAHVEVRVADTGQGISPDFLPHVFERFRQADGATTARDTGLGLGLGIVRQVVGLHGGTVHAASPGLGQGATFTVRLPIPAGDPSGARVVEDRALHLAAH